MVPWGQLAALPVLSAAIKMAPRYNTLGEELARHACLHPLQPEIEWNYNFDTIIDSGTTLILADQKTVDSFYNDIVYGSQKLDNGMWAGRFSFGLAGFV